VFRECIDRSDAKKQYRPEFFVGQSAEEP
jgi:hypothetical protein